MPPASPKPRAAKSAKSNASKPMPLRGLPGAASVAGGPPLAASSYWYLSTRPLHILCFLLPLLLLYELGTLVFLTDAGLVEVIRARLLLSRFLDVFGAVGFHLPPILLTIVLLCWHVFEREKWRVRHDVILGMGAESFLWTIPLVLLAAIAGTAAAFAQTAEGSNPHELSIPARITLSLGAGIYEELVFRLVLINLVHFLCADLWKLPKSTAFVIAAIVSAVAFTFYHNIQHPSGGADLGLLLTYGLAGLYFAVLFIVRGFGIVVATHAIYDVLALVVL